MRSIKTIASHGISSTIVTVETHLANGLPITVMVGLAHRSVIEAKERLRSAFASSGVRYPRKRVIINLVPTDIPKAGASLDLAIAVSILQANEQLPLTIATQDAFIGEISLSGDILPVTGIIGKLLAGKAAGITRYYLPAGNLNQAQLVPGLTLIPLLHLRNLVQHAQQIEPLSPIITRKSVRIRPAPLPAQTLAAIRGLDGAKRVLCIAAAGRHNVLLTGPPGVGKSLLAAALPGLLPAPSNQELLTITHLHSLGIAASDVIHRTRPLQAPHHSASIRELLGSAQRPGAISLAHHGVLLLDELPEFNRASLEALRQPLENHYINHGSTQLPTNFLLVGTANPCPCGYYGSPRPCSCTPYQIQRYQYKLSGPFLDRIDLHLSITTVEHQSLLLEKHRKGIDLPQTSCIQVAEKLQFERYGISKHNGRVTAAELSATSQLEPAAKQLLDQAAVKFGLSARAYIRVAGVARTIADLSESQTVLPEHVAEALQYRPQLRAARSM